MRILKRGRGGRSIVSVSSIYAGCAVKMYCVWGSEAVMLYFVRARCIGRDVYCVEWCGMRTVHVRSGCHTVQCACSARMSRCPVYILGVAVVMPSVHVRREGRAVQCTCVARMSCFKVCVRGADATLPSVNARRGCLAHMPRWPARRTESHPNP